MSGLFGIFNTAKSGLFAQQGAINTSSHNIANANTAGYTRQRVRLETNTPYDNPGGAGQLGTGVHIGMVERVRDNFLDFQIREQSGVYGQYTGRNTFLTQVENVINEPSDSGVSKLIDKFFNSWEDLSRQAQSVSARTVVAQQASALAKELNNTYNQLSKLEENADELIRQNTYEINNSLDQLNDLNQQIKNVKVSGQEPNDLLDKRDLIIDNLSKKFGIDIDKKNFDGIDFKPKVDGTMEGVLKDKIYLVKAQDKESVSRFSYISSIEKVKAQNGEFEFKVTYFKKGDNLSDDQKDTFNIKMKVDDYNSLTEDGKKEANLKINNKISEMLEGRMIWASEDGTALAKDSNLEINCSSANLTKELGNLDQSTYMFRPSTGELGGYMSIHKDIEGYKDSLNKIAKGIALSVNAVHSGVTSAKDGNGSVAKDEMPFFVNKDVAKYGKNANNKSELTNLDDILEGESEITAQNIAINQVLVDDPMQIKTRTNDYKYGSTYNNKEDGAGDGERALQIAMLRDKLIRIQDINGYTKREDLFTTAGGNTLENGMNFGSAKDGASIDSSFRSMINTIGVQQQQAKRVVQNQEKLLSSYSASKESVSGVSLDEEMAELIKYQHAYSANAKIISTVDELLDVVINGLKR